MNEGRSGEVQHARSLAPFTIPWGHGSSPTLHGDHVILLCDHESRAPASSPLTSGPARSAGRRPGRRDRSPTAPPQGLSQRALHGPARGRSGRRSEGQCSLVGVHGCPPTSRPSSYALPIPASTVSSPRSMRAARLMPSAFANWSDRPRSPRSTLTEMTLTPAPRLGRPGFLRAFSQRRRSRALSGRDRSTTISSSNSRVRSRRAAGLSAAYLFTKLFLGFMSGASDDGASRPP